MANNDKWPRYIAIIAWHGEWVANSEPEAILQNRTLQKQK